MNESAILSSDKAIGTLSHGAYKMTMFSAIEGIADIWSDLVDDSNVFLSVPYLKALEIAPPSKMSFYYVTVAREEQLCGVIYLQLDHFNAQASLNYARNGSEKAQESRVKKAVRDFVAQRIDFYTLISGNSMITGPHGFQFVDGIDFAFQLELVDRSLEWAQRISIEQGFDVQLLFIKDFYQKGHLNFKNCLCFPKYNEFQAQPAMTMKLRPEWDDFGDYISALSSKYRVRVKRAKKKLGDIELRRLTLDEVILHQDEIYKYYRAIADKASFNLFVLNKGYFAALKEQMGEKCHIYGCFDSGRLVAFYSLLENGTQLEAHFLGYREKLNRDHQLYLNMLLNIIEFAIEEDFETIFFARTALEIKSSIGAEADDMYFYLQHSKGLHNKLLPRIYSLLDPVEDWTPRKPFKA